MNNVIFGSGIIGLFAKALFPTWKVIPFARSRFFSFNPATDDNFIIRHERIDEAIRDICQIPVTNHFMYRRAFDVGGHLFNSYNKNLCQDWLTKFMGLKIPGQVEPYLRDRLDLFVYDLRINQLYATLMDRYLPELKQEYAKGKVIEIGDHYFVRQGVDGKPIREEFDSAITTIPLNALNKLMGYEQDLPCKPVHILHVQTKNLDFEGFNQVLVTDHKLSFYKVTNIAPERYLFYFHEEVPQPGPYLMALLREFEILDGTSISDYLTVGPMPKLDHLEAKGLYSVGSYAQWDWCMDVSSCVLRLVRYAQRDFKPFKKELTPL